VDQFSNTAIVHYFFSLRPFFLTVRKWTCRDCCYSYFQNAPFVPWSCWKIRWML